MHSLMIQQLHNFVNVSLKCLSDVLSMFNDGKYFSFITNSVALLILCQQRKDPVSPIR